MECMEASPKNIWRHLRGISEGISRECMEAYPRNIWRHPQGMSGGISKEYLEASPGNIWRHLQGICGGISKGYLEASACTHTCNMYACMLHTHMQTFCLNRFCIQKTLAYAYHFCYDRSSAQPAYPAYPAYPTQPET